LKQKGSEYDFSAHIFRYSVTMLQPKIASMLATIIIYFLLEYSLSTNAPLRRKDVVNPVWWLETYMH